VLSCRQRRSEHGHEKDRRFGGRRKRGSSERDDDDDDTTTALLIQYYETDSTNIMQLVSYSIVQYTRAVYDLVSGTIFFNEQ